MLSFTNNDTAGIVWLQNAPVLLRDGNGAIYPLAKDCNGGIRDPTWFNLSAAHSIGMAVHSVVPVAPLAPAATSGKVRIAIIAVALEVRALSKFTASHRQFLSVNTL